MGSLKGKKAQKPHAVCIPFPSQGHINPMLKISILVHSKGFHITFVNSEYNHKRFLKSRGHSSLEVFQDFVFETIPDGLPPIDADTTQHIPSLCFSTKENCLAPFKELLIKINSSNDVPPVTCIIFDGIMTFAVLAAQEIGVPSVSFRTTNACSFMCNKHLPLLIEKGILPLKDANDITNGYLDTVIDCIPSMKNLRLREFPSQIRTTDINDKLLNFIMGETEGASKASAIIFHTFDSLEFNVLRDLSLICPPLYTIGPLHLLTDQLPENNLKFLRANLWKEDEDCLQWLNSKEEKSVVYVNFGSITVLTKTQLMEFAWGLANSKKNFFWVIRSDAVIGDDSAMLPNDFVKETKERGLISRWCCQEQVLKHSSIGVFLTHCGWNSVMESIGIGVPMICWPFFADQHINCRYVCCEWGVGLEIGKNVKRDEVEKIVREVMDGEKGKKVKKKASEWKKLAEEATGLEGSSSLNLDKLVKDVLLSKNSVH
ncbi:7-deoxyloganetin glucosyltransferase-like [Nicotiana tomentosiformis]|uniref:7-deoxyloganetin glucosyltransferase-like n=1 Tax=Nicotiana tomentosiformis TaxID=4098 RepID=UPI00051BBDBA|nr:7-deoxyloganetin glucosyltransferase-like [Nicotiana tomentosiformis]